MHNVVLFAALVAAVPACTFERIPNQDEAERVVLDLYRERHSAPGVEWIPAERLDCDDGRGWMLAGRCLHGYFDGIYAHVANNRDGRIAWTSYAHELYHAHLFYNTGDGDPFHLDRGWEPGGIVYNANQLLEHFDY